METAGHTVRVSVRLGGLNFESQFKTLSGSLDSFTIQGDYFFIITTDNTLPEDFNKNLNYLKVRGYSFYILQEIRSLSSPNIVYVRSKTSGNGSFGEWMKLS